MIYKKYIKEIIVFITFMFSFLLIEKFLNTNILVKLGETYVLPIYAITLLSTALGNVNTFINNYSFTNKEKEICSMILKDKKNLKKNIHGMMKRFMVKMMIIN